MKKILFCFSLLIFITTTQATGWQIGAGFYYADISGINTYEASANENTQDTKALTVPSFFIAKSFNDKFNLVFRYTTYDDIISNGVSSNLNIFNDPNLIFPSVVTPYRIKEKMNEGSFSFNYAFVNNKKWRVEAGPTVSITKSNADFFILGPLSNTQNNGPESLRKFSQTDYTLGAEANVILILSENVNLNFNYRYTNPSEKNIHLIGALISLNF